MALPSTKEKCGSDFIVGELHPPLTSCWKLPGAWGSLCGMTKAEAWAQKDLLPCY